MSYQMKKLRPATGFHTLPNPETGSLANAMLAARPALRDLVDPVHLKTGQHAAASRILKINNLPISN
jgi:hypothetical protein